MEDVQRHAPKVPINIDRVGIRGITVPLLVVAEEWQQADGQGAGTLTLVYDHHKNDLARRLTQMQHDEHDIIIATLHVHLDHHNCLEVLILKGEAARVRALADKLISCKGVKHGTFSGTTTGQDLA